MRGVVSLPGEKNILVRIWVIPFDVWRCYFLRSISYRNPPKIKYIPVRIFEESVRYEN